MKTGKSVLKTIVEAVKKLFTCKRSFFPAPIEVVDQRQVTPCWNCPVGMQCSDMLEEYRHQVAVYGWDLGNDGIQRYTMQEFAKVKGTPCANSEKVTHWELVLDEIRDRELMQ
jgi:hypothetical protein